MIKYSFLSKSKYNNAFDTVLAFWPLARSVTTPSKMYRASRFVFSLSKLTDVSKGAMFCKVTWYFQSQIRYDWVGGVGQILKISEIIRGGVCTQIKVFKSKNLL